MKMKKFIALLTVAGMTATMAVGCGSSSNETSDNAADTNTESSDSSLSGTITAAGSSALKPLADDAADSFLNDHPDVSITIDAGGSGEGLKQVSEGTVDIGNSDVAADTKLDKAVADGLVDHKVCVVTMAPVVNKDIAATVKSLTKQQLTDIFTAKITNWKEVGGPDEEIVLITRPSTSGTRALFKEFALGGAEEASNKSLETDDSGTLLQSIKDNKGAIGYVALSYLVNNQDVATVSVDGVAPTLENTYNGTYPVWGYEHMYTKGEPNATVKAYLDFIMSDEYGKSMEAQGYGVTSKMQVQR